MTSAIQQALDQAQWLTSTLPIRLFGDPVLSTHCGIVTDAELESGEAQHWADQMVEFLQAYRAKTGGGRGLAANQLGIPKQMVLVWLDTGPEIFVNPHLESTDGQGMYPESCISSAGLILGDVVRPWTIKLSYTTLEGKKKTVEPDPIHSRLLLHELDHLKGIVCSDKYEPGTIRLTTGDKDQILKPELKRLK
jgi:peptide deformylase